MGRNKEKEKVKDAKRSRVLNEKGNIYQKNNPEWARDRMRRIRASGRNDGIYAKMIDRQMNPLNIKCDNVIYTSDWHIPFYDINLKDALFKIAEDYSVDTLCVAGDFWDCDNYSQHVRLSWAETFKQEIEEIRSVLRDITETFKITYFCRGNHEKRWINLNMAMMGMEELFALTRIHTGYEVTTDDHMYLYQGNQKWLLCHPRNFRQVNLSVAKDLAAKYQCNVVSGHGHQFAQGWDRSGRYRIADGGGLFHRESIAYLRETSCHPMTRNGFYVIQDNELIPFEPFFK